MEKAYRNIGFLFLLFVPLTFFGFYNTYFVLAPAYEGTINVYTHIHAAVASTWILLLIVQPLLIRYRNVELHRTYGKVSLVVFGALLTSFIPQMISEYGKGLFPLNALADIILLILFFTLAVRHRKKVDVHMRYMIAIALIFVGPTVGRIIGITLDLGQLMYLQPAYLLVLALLVILIFWDKANQRNYRPYIIALISFTIYLIALYTVSLEV